MSMYAEEASNTRHAIKGSGPMLEGDSKGSPALPSHLHVTMSDRPRVRMMLQAGHTMLWVTQSIVCCTL